jgi:hypothetical protein
MTIPLSVLTNMGGYDGITLPATKFFHPNNTFIEYMNANFDHKKLIYDVGAGCGHISKLLMKSDFNVEALDLIRRDKTEYSITYANSLIYNFVPGSVVMFCRPCHGLFVLSTIDNAIACGVSIFLYVGLGKNVNDDLGYDYPFNMVCGNVGSDEEDIWRYDV